MGLTRTERLSKHFIMNDRGTSITASVVFVACLAAATTLAGIIQKQRDDLNLIVKMEGVSGMPPHVAVVTAALGTFRGLAVDMLWARADHLEREGEYYEAQTLAQWITTLQPRFKKVWWFQSFNMAWNISAATQVPAERWGWVKKGIELLRSRGIPLNPGAADLYFDLAWIFENKISSNTDKEHWYYKARLAAEMQEVLGDMTSGKTADQIITSFQKIVDAPSSLIELEKDTPEINKALEFLDSNGLKADEETLRMLGRAIMYLASFDATILKTSPLPPGTNKELLLAMQADKEMAALIFNDLVPYLQKRVLEDHYQMSPDRMLDVMNRYGPLDWRHGDSHGIYWSEQGVKVSRALERREQINELSLVRGRLMMIINLMRSGKIDYDAVSKRLDLLPDPRFAPKFETAIEDALELINSDQGVAAADFGLAEEADLFATWETFLNLATILNFLYGDETEAQKYFKQYKKLLSQQGFDEEPAFQGTLENFVAIRFADMAEVKLGDLRQLIDAMIRRSLVQGLAQGNLKTFNRFIKLAKAVYDKRYGAAERGEDTMLDYNKLLPFPKLLENSFQKVITEESLAILLRARMWAWAPEQLRQSVYQSTKDTLERQALAADLDPLRAFPPPQGDDQSASEKPTTTNISE